MLSSSSQRSSKPLVPGGSTVNASSGASSLFTDPVDARFGDKQVEAFVAHLRKIDAITRVTPITVIDEMRLGPTGATRLESYRYTTIGLNQVATELGYGLANLLPDLVGAGRGDNDPDECDLQTAINTFNAILLLRFKRLQRMRLIRDTQHNLIDGIVGAHYLFTENVDVYGAIDEAVRRSTVPMQFLAGVTVGRRMSVWFRSVDPVFVVTTKQAMYPFWVGYFFCNGEISKTSLQATQVVYNQFGGALRPWSGAREKHSGRHFLRRASHLFQRVVERDWKLNEYAERAKQLTTVPLGVVGADQALREKQELKLIDILCRRGLPQRIVQDVVHSTMCVGADLQTKTAFEMASGMTYGVRTAYDLFCSLLRISKQLGPQRRGRIEMAAYELLSGKLKLTGG